jgi:hypothetical protein
MEGLRSSMSWLGGAKVTFSGESIQVSVHHPGSQPESALEHYLFKRRGGGLFATPNSIPSHFSDVSTSRTLDWGPQSLVNRRCERQNYSRLS